VLPAAHWDEREARDLFGVVPLAHPDPRRLVLPDTWPDGVHPLRRETGALPPPAGAGAGWVPVVAEGDGVVRMPVGPVHAGIIESGHFVFSLMGETILHLDVRLFWKHRGVEKALEGLPWSEVAPLVERVCVGCTVSHQDAWSQAVEALTGWEVPPRTTVEPAADLRLPEQPKTPRCVWSRPEVQHGDRVAACATHLRRILAGSRVDEMAASGLVLPRHSAPLSPSCPLVPAPASAGRHSTPERQGPRGQTTRPLGARNLRCPRRWG
jgi:hypothetical protein